MSTVHVFLNPDLEIMKNLMEGEQDRPRPYQCFCRGTRGVGDIRNWRQPSIVTGGPDQMWSSGLCWAMGHISWKSNAPGQELWESFRHLSRFPPGRLGPCYLGGLRQGLIALDFGSHLI